jgi:adenosine deaminase
MSLALAELHVHLEGTVPPALIGSPLWMLIPCTVPALGAARS